MGALHPCLKIDGCSAPICTPLNRPLEQFNRVVISSKKMATARKEAIAMGLVFFWIKFSLWIALILLSSSIGPLSELPTLPYVALEIFIVFLACSALPDLALVYG